MKLQFRTDHPPTAGHYVVRLGNQTLPDLNAAQVAKLLESEKSADAKVFRIHYVHPDGRMELVGVPAERFQLEDGLIFWRRDAAGARDDFLTLARLADQTPPPCRAKLQLAELSGSPMPHCTALIFPAEYAIEMSGWLTGIGYAGGTTADGGISQVTDYYAAITTVALRRQLWGTQDGTLLEHAAESHAAGA